MGVFFFMGHSVYIVKIGSPLQPVSKVKQLKKERQRKKPYCDKTVFAQTTHE